MFDPIGGFLRIREFFLTYLETAFRIGNPAVSAERRQLLEAAGSLCTSPLLEPLPRYRQVDWKLSELPSPDGPLDHFTDDERRDFIRLVSSGLFDSDDARLYRHQAEMLRRGSRAGHPGIVTSGTGSGKTESFLLPVFASIVREGRTWNAHLPNDTFWWHDANGRAFDRFTQIPKAQRPLAANPKVDPFVARRHGEKRPAAVRCMIIYPMNALVEDQLSRLRKALDSEAARATVLDILHGNRIYFGRYTSETPVTGFNIHPRIPPADDYKRRGRKLTELFDEMVQFERSQRVVRDRPEEDRYLFPSPTGAELLTRWDMQATPPDILITNVSMLGAMLNREVDAPIFQSTKDWLVSNPDAYFYLVLDELHLQRGAAGTEVAYLLRLLLDRLGLTASAHRHKLRILASSASLPTTGEEGLRSEQYLWDMYGRLGTATTGEDAGAQDAAYWRGAIVAGEHEPEAPEDSNKLDPGAFEAFLAAQGASATDPATDQSMHEPAWRAVALALGLPAMESIGDTVESCIEQAGRRLALACWSVEDERPRATDVDTLAGSLFDPPSAEAVRGLLLVRGLGDVFDIWFPDRVGPQAPSFRLHTFFRSIEGLFAPVIAGGGVRPIGELSLERAVSQLAEAENELPARLVEVLYCECCGELFVGGMRRRRTRAGHDYELLPNEAELDGLPDAASSRLFEDLSYERYGVFWPSNRQQTPSVGSATEAWIAAHLDPMTGVVKAIGPGGNIPANDVRGWLFTRSQQQDDHKRTNISAGTNVPYQCPACNTEYTLRQRPLRLSPLRHFRTGFAKTTQLLASELFHLLRLRTHTPKLVSFSDSRQDAAKAALDIESRHHEDVRREILIRELRRIRDGSPTAVQIQAQRAQLRQQRDEAEDQGNYELGQLIAAQLTALQRQEVNLAEGTIPLADILESTQGVNYLGPAANRIRLKPLIRSFVELGIHPTHPAGTKDFRVEQNGEARWYSWNQLFEIRDGVYDWRDDATEQQWINTARTQLVRLVHELINETLFNRSYFSLEETGLGYLTLPRAPFVGAMDLHETYSTLVRVFGDAYRLQEGPFNTPPWSSAGAISNQNRVFLFASQVWPGDARTRLDDVLQRFGTAGHLGGLLDTERLRVRLSEPTDPAWRCLQCARVHLRLGPGRCTRCYAQLPINPNLLAADVMRGNFLARRVTRSTVGPFRLHCEELTGQTEDGPKRQRKFRGILMADYVPRRDASGARVFDEDGEEILDHDPHYLVQQDEIDLLAVTTTMEVGIDIGQLQSVLQANMPPQRFNYQQRVGRAGRRRQAFSLVLTVCRTKSHDLYYFREPRRITGDVPPPPFLTKSMPNIARRFLRKFWLNRAFEQVRSGWQGAWPADGMSPPDIHGEFVPTGLYFSDQWRQRLRVALLATEAEAVQFVQLLCADSTLIPDDVSTTVDGLLDEIDAIATRQESQRPGLAHSLAEQGSLPMYGMPTRVRDLYIGHQHDSVTKQQEWVTIDRDVDLAVYEFAPGSEIVKDKQRHICVGFTGPMPGFILKVPDGPKVIPYSPAFGDPFWMLECLGCGAWFRFDVTPADPIGDCESCDAPLDPQRSKECREPLGFRTNFRPRDFESEAPGGRHRSIQSQAGDMDFDHCAPLNVSVFLGQQMRTYRINRGPVDPANPGAWTGFSATAGSQQLTRKPNREAFLERQYLADNMLGTPASPLGFTPYTGVDAERVGDIWLTAPKTTDLLHIVPTVVPAGLSLERVIGARTLDGLSGGDVLRALAATAVRASALSATFLLVNRAAIDLDIDPEEFDVIEPRMFRPGGGAAVPVLQFADHLVNGAGFCTALRAVEPDGRVRIARLLDEMLNSETQYPLVELLRGNHEDTCEQACYRCLLRYRNQPYHGLLDWRLGLAFLGTLANANFRCGLDGTFDSIAMREWHQLVQNDVLRLQRQFTTVQVRNVGQLKAVRFAANARWAVIGHPLWDPDNVDGILSEAVAALAEPFVVVDSFNIARRPVTIRRAILEM